jgi:predicted nucleic acid-binding protein
LTLVVDASVVAKWFLDEPLWESARALVISGEELVAPDFLLVEVANVLWRRMRRGEVDPVRAQGNVRTLIRGAPEFFDSHVLMSDALRLAGTLDHPVYDCLYLALAIHDDTRVITNDRRFHERVEASDFAGRTRLLSDQAPRGGG